MHQLRRPRAVLLSAAAVAAVIFVGAGAFLAASSAHRVSPVWTAGFGDRGLPFATETTADRVVVTTDFAVVVLDRDNGERLWRRDLDEGDRTLDSRVPRLFGDTVVVPRDGFYAFEGVDLDTGETRYTVKLDAGETYVAVPAPVIVTRLCDPDGCRFRGRDAATGAVAWEGQMIVGDAQEPEWPRELGGDTFSALRRTPVGYGIIGSGRGAVAVDLATGATLSTWHDSDITAFDGHVLGRNGDTVRGLDPVTGGELWRAGDRGTMFSSNGRLVFGTPERNFITGPYLVTGDDGNAREGDTLGRLLIGAADSGDVFFNPATGTLEGPSWMVHIGGRAPDTAQLIGDRLMLSSGPRTWLINTASGAYARIQGQGFALTDDGLAAVGGDGMYFYEI
ncbi:hypothetical protein Afil01_18170 [Actinorhabdospora filicis]|uniref:Pyrrolo-quinoline quinone repeat domain-containing protein n=1 Tax=Actinorhabdospora filicis TaxID=1785913 RepID=A0A9W6SJC1_9ACTN|nr:PQQ-binding-like beta-propeller repeat protein [Actinorhabdospora filicis]GLZ77010.1 hypothetical protein Afil01_18170 [Actinorhabdospora filicis]